MDPKKFRVTFLVFPLLLFALWQTGSCHSENRVTEKKPNRVAAGTWGGQNIRLEVSDSGAKLEFPCAAGTIDEALILDSAGRFSAKGTLTAGSMGPTREDKPPKPQPAVYSGTVHDESMALTVKLSNTNDQPGEYTLEFGKPGRVRRCY